MGFLSIQTASYWLNKIGENHEAAAIPSLEVSIKSNALSIKPNGFYGNNLLDNDPDAIYFDVLRNIKFGDQQQKFNERTNLDGSLQFPDVTPEFKQVVDAELDNVGCTPEENQVFMSLGLQKGGMIYTTFAILDKIFHAWGFALDNRANNCTSTNHVTKTDDRLTCTQTCESTTILPLDEHGSRILDATILSPVFVSTTSPALKLTTKFSVKAEQEHYRYGVDTIDVELHPNFKKLFLKKIELLFKQKTISKHEVEKLIPLLEIDADLKKLIIERVFKRREQTLFEHFVMLNPSLAEDPLFARSLNQYLFEHSDPTLFEIFSQKYPRQAFYIFSVYSQNDRKNLLFDQTIPGVDDPDDDNVSSPIRFSRICSDPTPKLTKFLNLVTELAKNPHTLALAVRYCLKLIKDEKTVAYLIRHNKFEGLIHRKKSPQAFEAKTILAELIKISPALREACLRNKKIRDHFYTHTTSLSRLLKDSSYDTALIAHIALTHSESRKSGSKLATAAIALRTSNNLSTSAAGNLLSALKEDAKLAEKVLNAFPKKIQPEVQHELAKKHGAVAKRQLSTGKVSTIEAYYLADSHPNDPEVIRKIFGQRAWPIRLFKKRPCDGFNAAMLLSCYLNSKYARERIKREPKLMQKILDGTKNENMAQQLDWVIAQCNDTVIAEYVNDPLVQKLINASSSLSNHLMEQISTQTKNLTPAHIAKLYLLHSKLRAVINSDSRLLDLLCSNTNPNILRDLLDTKELVISADKRAELETRMKENQSNAATDEAPIAAAAPEAAATPAWRKATANIIPAMCAKGLFGHSLTKEDAESLANFYHHNLHLHTLA